MKKVIDVIAKIDYDEHDWYRDWGLAVPQYKRMIFYKDFTYSISRWENAENGGVYCVFIGEQDWNTGEFGILSQNISKIFDL